MGKSSGKKPGAGKKRLGLNAKSGQAAAGLIVASAIASQAESTSNPSSLTKQPAPAQKPEQKQSSKDTQHLDQLAAAFPVASDDEFAALVSDNVAADDNAQSAISDAQALLEELASEAGAPASGVEPILVADATGVTDVPVASYGEPMLLAAADPAATSASGGSAAAGGEAAAGGAAATTTAGAFALPMPALAALGAVAVAAGGGGGGGGSSSSSSGSSGSSNTGTVIDGPVKSATVFYDADNDNVLDPGEVFTTTRADGSYTLTGYTVTPEGKIVVAAGGIDTFTGKTIGTIMTAKADEDGTTTITPLTTLLASTSLTEAELKAALGIPASVDINDFDPYAAMQSSDATTKALGEQLFTLSQQIFTAIQAATQLQVTSGGASATAAAGNVLNGVAAALKTVSALPAGQQSGQGLLDTISTFAVAAASGVDVSAVQGSASALTSLNSSLASNTTANQVLNAVKTITETIGTAYDGLADKVASGGDTSQAQAVAALAQSTLLTGIADGNTNTLTALSSSATLNSLVQQVADQIQNAGDGDLEDIDLDLPEIVSITETEAAALIAGGIEASEVFDADALVTVQAEGTVLSTSLKDLQALGVDFIASDPAVIAVPGQSPDIVLALGAGTLDTAHIPQFAAGDSTVLRIGDGQVGEVVSAAAALKDAGVDIIGAADGSLTLSAAQSGALQEAGLRFAAPDEVTINHTDSSLVNGIARVEAALASPSGQVGVDVFDMTDDSAVISDAAAAILIQGGVEFAMGDDVQVNAEGTHLATSLKGLNDLHVDEVVSHNGEVILDLGMDLSSSSDPGGDLVAALQNLPAGLFLDGDDVRVTMSQDSYDALVNDASGQTGSEAGDLLAGLGVDFIKVIGSTDPDMDPDNL